MSNIDPVLLQKKEAYIAVLEQISNPHIPSRTGWGSAEFYKSTSKISGTTHSEMYSHIPELKSFATTSREKELIAIVSHANLKQFHNNALLETDVSELQNSTIKAVIAELRDDAKNNVEKFVPAEKPKTFEDITTVDHITDISCSNHTIKAAINQHNWLTEHFAGNSMKNNDYKGINSIVIGFKGVLPYSEHNKVDTLEQLVKEKKLNEAKDFFEKNFDIEQYKNISQQLKVKFDIKIKDLTNELLSNTTKNANSDTTSKEADKQAAEAKAEADRKAQAVVSKVQPQIVEEPKKRLTAEQAHQRNVQKFLNSGPLELNMQQYEDRLNFSLGKGYYDLKSKIKRSGFDFSTIGEHEYNNSQYVTDSIKQLIRSDLGKTINEQHNYSIANDYRDAFENTDRIILKQFDTSHIKTAEEANKFIDEVIIPTRTAEATEHITKFRNNINEILVQSGHAGLAATQQQIETQPKLPETSVQPPAESAPITKSTEEALPIVQTTEPAPVSETLPDSDWLTKSLEDAAHPAHINFDSAIPEGPHNQRPANHVNFDNQPAGPANPTEANPTQTQLERTQQEINVGLDKVEEIKQKNSKSEAPPQSTDARPAYVEPNKKSGKAPGSGKTEGKTPVEEKGFLGKYGTAIGIGILAISALAAIKHRDDDSPIVEEGAEENNQGGLHHRAKEALHRFHKYRGGSFKRSSYDSDSNRSHAVVGAIAGATAFGIKGQELFSNLAKRENILKGNNPALFGKAFNAAETAWGVATGVSKITRSNNAQDRVSGVADIVNAALIPSAANRIVEAVAGKTKSGVGIEIAKLGVQFGLAGATSYMARHLGMAIDKKGNKGYNNPTMEYKPTPDQNTDAIAAHDSPGDFAMSMVTRDLPMARKEVDKKLHHLINNGYAY